MSNIKYLGQRPISLWLKISNGKHPTSHLSPPTSTKGFTFIEFLIIMSIVVLIGLTSVPFLSRFFTQNAVSNTYDQLAAELRKAQTYAMTGKQNGPWGVYYNGAGKKITLYQGNSYATHTNTAFDESFNINSNISVTGFSDINFSQITGTTSAAATITITANNTNRMITVNTQGIVNFAIVPTNPPTPTPTPAPTIAFDNSGSKQGVNVSSLSWSYTIGSQSNRILLVAVSIINASQSVNNITYAGNNLTRLNQTNCGQNVCREELWYLIVPSGVTGTNTLAVTLSSLNASFIVGVASFYNVSQTPPATSVINSGTGTSASVTVAASAGQLVFDTLATATTGWTVGSSQTQLWNLEPSNTGAGSYQTVATAGNITNNWTNGGSHNWGEIGVALSPGP